MYNRKSGKEQHGMALTFSKQLQNYQNIIEKALDGLLPEQDCPQKEGIDAMRYSLLGGGKRIRAVLVLEFARIFGVPQDQAMPFAVAVEMIHAYSLIHDDLPCMDNDDFRRGKPSCHKQFSEASAVLAGDGLLTHAFLAALQGGLQSGVSPERVAEAAAVLAEAAGIDGMLGGQVIDLAIEGKQVEAGLHQKMCSLKTGALIKASCLMGCILGGASGQDKKISEEYAEKIGLSFQIIDDILDCTGQQEILGKPIGSDEGQHKTTYVTLYGLEAAKKMSQKLSEEALLCLERLPLPDRFLFELTDMLLKRQF